MNNAHLRAWLTLYFTPRLGPKGLSRLLTVDHPLHLLSYSAKQLMALGLNSKQVDYLRHPSKTQLDTCFHWLESGDDHHIITRDDPNYPALLQQISAAPPVLFVKGQLKALSQPQIGIVGSRNASVDGRQSAGYFARQLTAQGVTVTSGLALGIDGYAHDGALHAGGNTIAVLGAGLKHIYPARHKGLAQRITEQGALVSEFHPDAKPIAAHFPRRNRIISGLSLGVLVVEAAERSGSLITARYATEQNREVFVVPGLIDNPLARGSNQLIRQGACLVQNVEDILSELNPLLNWANKVEIPQQTLRFAENEAKEELPFPLLLANVGNKPTPVDILADRTNIPVHEVMMQILELELLGHVVAVSGGYIRKGRG